MQQAPKPQQVPLIPPVSSPVDLKYVISQTIDDRVVHLTMSASTAGTVAPLESATDATLIQASDGGLSGLLMVEQLGKALKPEILAAAEANQASAQPPSSVSTPSSLPGPVRILVIKLEPAELGTITVRMALKGDSLDLRMEADKRETSESLQSLRDVLKRELLGIGDGPKDLSIEIVNRPAAPLDMASTARDGNKNFAQGNSASDFTGGRGGGTASGGSGGAGSRPGADDDAREPSRPKPNSGETLNKSLGIYV